MNLIKKNKVNVIVDGAFGSTGKGAASNWLYETSRDTDSRISNFTTNASPNAGHTSYLPSGEKVVTRHLCNAGIAANYYNNECLTILNSGAIIDPELLKKEIQDFKMQGKVLVHPNATVIHPRHKEIRSSLSAIASTQKGTGPAMADRLLRFTDAVASECKELNGLIDYKNGLLDSIDGGATTLMTVPQGYSLGLHSGFYPYTTNRECTVAQGLSDIGISHHYLGHVMMCIRTFPIRVGNTANGNSGPCYKDQSETTWEKIGQIPETTTVTGRIRRVFTFSWEQFKLALIANGPDSIWVGFMDYLSTQEQESFIQKLVLEYKYIMNKMPEAVIGSFGPKFNDAKVVWK